MTAPSTESHYDSLWELVAHRLYWFFVGPMILVLMLLAIVNDAQQHALVYGGVYLVALALMPCSRWLDIRTGRGETADGQPANWSHWWRYTTGVILVGVIALVAAIGWALLAPGEN